MLVAAINLSPDARQSGWYEARTTLDYPAIAGVVTVSGNSELTALRGLLEKLVGKVRQLEVEEDRKGGA